MSSLYVLTEEDDQSKLPQWVIVSKKKLILRERNWHFTLLTQRYYKRKIEKDKQVNEYEKKREKENECHKLASVVGGIIKQSTLLQSKSRLLTTTAGSKRNLCGKLEELEQSKSKRTNATVTDTKPMTQRWISKYKCHKALRSLVLHLDNRCTICVRNLDLHTG